MPRPAFPPAPASRTLVGATLPPRLADLNSPPERAHLVGELPVEPLVAVVGTRTPSVEARCFAFCLARDLARAGVAVASGGAAGIDTAAHLGALRGRGSTLVVAPAGYLRPFPAFNARLFSAVVARGGAYLSLLADDEPAQPGTFFRRNACMAALAHAVVVVETRVRGGARNAARSARRLGRPLLVVPSAPWIPSGAGCALEIRLGAELCTGVGDVLKQLERVLAVPPGSAAARNVVPPPRPEVPPVQVSLPFSTTPEGTPGLSAVLSAVHAGARHLDEICELSGLTPAAAQNHVLTLTLEGVLVADPSGGLAPKRTNGPVSLRNSRK